MVVCKVESISDRRARVVEDVVFLKDGIKRNIPKNTVLVMSGEVEGCILNDSGKVTICCVGTVENGGTEILEEVAVPPNLLRFL